MSLARFQACLPVLLMDEGGFVDHPRDPGGATNLGVTLETAIRNKLDIDGDGDVDKDDVRKLTPALVAPVFSREYWRAASCDACPAGLDYMVFDCAVNQGVGRATRWLQTVAGVKADGLVGPMTLAAVARLDATAAIVAFTNLRETHYRSLSTFDVFGKGWVRRLHEVKARALKQGEDHGA